MSRPPDIYESGFSVWQLLGLVGDPDRSSNKTMLYGRPFTHEGRLIGTQAANIPASTEITSPTTAEFNALVAAMRDSGLLEQQIVGAVFNITPSTVSQSFSGPPNPNTNEVQLLTVEEEVTGGTWEIISLFGDNTLQPFLVPWDVDAAGLQVLVDEAFSNPNYGFEGVFVSITGGPLADAPFRFEAIGSAARQSLPLSVVQNNGMLGSGLNQINRITGGGVISGGTWNLSIAGGTIHDIPWDIDAAGLDALMYGQPELFNITGGPLASAPFEIEFIGILEFSDGGPVTADATNLTGTNPTLTVVTVQDGIYYPASLSLTREQWGGLQEIMAPAPTVVLFDDMERICVSDNTTVVTMYEDIADDINGTLVKTAERGVATFDDLYFRFSGSHRLAFQLPGFDTVRSNSFTVTGCPNIMETGSGVNSPDGSSEDIEVILPPSWQNGDLLIAVVAFTGGTDVTITPPAGWALAIRTNNSTDLSVATYFKEAYGEPSIATFAFNVPSKAYAAALRITNWNTAIGIDYAGGTTSVGSTVTAESVPTVADDLVVNVFAALNNDDFVSVPDTVFVNSENPGAPAMAVSAFRSAESMGENTGTREADSGAEVAWVSQEFTVQKAPT